MLVLKSRVIQLFTVAAGMFGLSLVSAFASSSMQISRTSTSQPIGHYEYCEANPRECSIQTRNPVTVRATSQVMRTLVSVNRRINAAIQPVEDIDLYGQEEHWTIPKGRAGDCEDYVLLKQRELVAAGLPISSLLITVVRRPDGQGHAVLTVRTDKGDFILDNLRREIVQWRNTPYTYLKIQSARHTGRWVAITNGDARSVAAVP